jgi:hypothetical protein
MPIITDIAIAELSLVFAEKGGQKFRPVNPEASIITTKAQAEPRESLLGKYADELHATTKSQNDADETALAIAYDMIVNTLYSVLDDMWYISSAPESFTVEARKDAMKTLIDNFVKKIGESSSLVLKAQINGEPDVIAQPPFQAPPGDHPNRPTTIVETPPVVADSATTESTPVAYSTTTVQTPSEAPQDEPESDEKAKAFDALKAQLATLAETVKAQGDLIVAKDAEVAAATIKASEATAALAASVVKAQESTPNATATRTLQEAAKNQLAVPDFKAVGIPGSSGALEAAIFAQLAPGSQIPN